MEKKQKLIKNILLILQVINITVIASIFVKNIFDERIKINYLLVAIILVIYLLGLIYLKINLKKENTKGKLIALIFILQVIVIFRIPVYGRDMYNVRDYKMKNAVFNEMNVPPIVPMVVPSELNVYGISIDYFSAK